ncbi:MAG: phosphoribosylformylglycinamidine synthase subunit PurL, partial [Leptolyngbyaceae cyanobacterium SM2_5_2]|nr:phosphoribosylformylglycinamidine synthase subunit PurL [Leptolyngbyaceae cyanobacterium SM2_5_2]
VLNSLRFGDLADSRTRRLCQGVVAGIAHYGNCFGVPTVGGEVYFDAVYNGNPLVNAMAIGIMETPGIVKSGAAGLGNPVVYVGSTTGRDGMGGASFASAELTDESEADRPAVQVGDPFLEKSLVEACLEAFKTGAIVAAQDMGAAGLTCSTSEMAAKGGVGIELDLDLIPVRETGMVPYEYLLSESQERMLFVVVAGREAEVIEIFERWGLHAVVAGTVIADPIVRILFKGEVAAEIPALALAENTPIYHRDLLSEPPDYAQTAWAWSETSLPACTVDGIVLPEARHYSWTAILHQLLSQPTLASKQWVYRQYDYQVQNNTVQGPGQGDAAVIRLRPQEPVPGYQPGAASRGLAATVDCNSRYVYLNPYEGAKAAVAEAARNLSCVGALPLAVTDNLNFGSPEKPIGYWQLAEACRGLADACREFETPVTGGNVSLYNETVDSQGNPQPIYPTPVVGMVGLIEDLSLTCGQGWRQTGDLIYLLGVPVEQTTAATVADHPLVTLGGSEYLVAVHQTTTGRPPAVDMVLEKRVQAACRYGIARGWMQSSHDCAEGGLVVALAESCISGGQGAAIQLPLAASQGQQRWDRLLFGEGGARIVVSVSPAQQQGWETYLTQTLPDHWQRLGTVQGEILTLTTQDGEVVIAGAVEQLSQVWGTAIRDRLTA